MYEYFLIYNNEKGKKVPLPPIFLLCIIFFVLLPGITVTGTLNLVTNSQHDDGQLMALIEILVEKDRPHLRPDFGPTDLADMLGVSMTRLYQLFRHQTIHRTPEAYIDNLRTLAALRLLREKPNYTIAVIAKEAGFSNVRTLQRRIQDAVGMSPVDYRLMLTRDI